MASSISDSKTTQNHFSSSGAKVSATGYHLQCSGKALETVEAHSQEIKDGEDPTGPGITIYGASFCPFVQRAWIALELLQAPYQYIEVDPYSKPASLLELNPKGLVPSLRLGEKVPNSKVKGLSESTVILEYLEDRYNLSQSSPASTSLFSTSDPYSKAKIRLACDSINRVIIPNFYRYLQSQEEEVEKRKEALNDFLNGLQKFVDSSSSSSKKGYWNGENLSLPDIMLIPWIIRADLVLTHYRGFDFKKLLHDGDDDKDGQSRFGRWYEEVKNDERVRKTTSNDDLYLDSYKRYADNKGHVSQVQQAINNGRALP